MPRNSHAVAILGPTLYPKLAETRVLMVGAGGIGCELLKNIVLTGFGDITLLDLDTIDLSNLNRQFLFRKKDVKQSKAMVAARSASAFNPACKITPIHANIKEEQYDVAWFQTFDIVLNALDNLDARRHVNKMCMAANVPLIESGTAGYLGQVQPILRDATECFDCMPKETPKTFPVCTIRSTPSTPIHCIVWAKSYLLPQLFGEQDEDESDLDQAAAQGENATEIANLRKEAAAFKNVRAALLASPSDQATAAVFDKIFSQDVKRLLSMGDMWKSRKPPTPLKREEILSGTFIAPVPPKSTEANGQADKVNGVNDVRATVNGATTASAGKLKDQKQLSLKEVVTLFDDSLNRLATRIRSGKETAISFDKDDEDTLDFVTATANLRAICYSIEQKTRWEVKEMAGNIIPAIATTNAVISGLIVLQALNVLRSIYSQAETSNAKSLDPSWAIASSSNPSGIRSVCLQSGKPSVPLGTYYVSPPNQLCGVCRDIYVPVACDSGRVTLGEIVRAVLRAEVASGTEMMDDEREVSVYEGTRMLCDPEWDDNYDRSLESLGCGRGKFLTFVDEDGKYENVVLTLSLLPEDTATQSPAFILPDPFPSLKPRTRPPAPTPAVDPVPPTTSRKRSAADDELPPAKRAKTEEVASNADGERDDDVIVISDGEEDVMEIL